MLIHSFEFCLIDKHTAKQKNKKNQRQHKNSVTINKQQFFFFFFFPPCLLIVINNCFLLPFPPQLSPPSSMSSSLFPFLRVYINPIKRTLHCRCRRRLLSAKPDRCEKYFLTPSSSLRSECLVKCGAKSLLMKNVSNFLFQLHFNSR